MHPPKPKLCCMAWNEKLHASASINAHKTEYMCFNQTGDISTLNRSSLKLVDNITYLGSRVPSIETGIITRLAKAWTAIDKLSVIEKSDLTDKMKHSFFQAAVGSILLNRCTIWKLTNVWGKSLTATTQECYEQYWTIMEAAPHKAAAVRPPTAHYKNYQY